MRQQVGVPDERAEPQQHLLQEAPLNAVPKGRHGAVAHVRNPLRDAAALRGVVQEEVLKREVLKTVVPGRRPVLQDRGGRVRHLNRDEREKDEAGRN